MVTNNLLILYFVENYMMFINFNELNRFAHKYLYTATSKRLALIGLCHSLYHIFNWFFDFVLYVYVVYTWGMLVGGGIMIVLSLILCAVSLYIYECMQVDWVGSGAMREWQSQHPRTLSGRLFHHIKSSPIAVFMFLCVLTDAFIITAYFRHGRFDGLTAKDWRLFFFSNFICNVYWICVSVLLGNGAANLWQWLILHTDYYGNRWLFEHVLVLLYRIQTLWEQLLAQANSFL
jgi:hypothetical protein